MEQLAAKLDELSKKIDQYPAYKSPYDDPKSLRASVIMTLLQTNPDAQAAMRKAKTICDFIESGKLIEAVS